MKRKLFLALFLLLALAACNLSNTPPDQAAPPTAQVVTVVHTQESTVEVEVTREVFVPVTITPSPTPELSPTPTLTPTITPIPSITPTPAPVEGSVNQLSHCRYGPGAAYLNEHAFGVGLPVELLARNKDASWVYVLGKWFPSGCWIKVDLIDWKDGSDLFSVGEYYGLLPKSDLYVAPTSVSAQRSGDLVTVIWQGIYMTEDDYRGYLIEAWVCREGQIVFTPIHIDGTAVEIVDESGCLGASSARLFAAEKHGYTGWTGIVWPQAP